MYRKVFVLSHNIIIRPECFRKKSIEIFASQNLDWIFDKLGKSNWDLKFSSCQGTIQSIHLSEVLQKYSTVS